MADASGIGADMEVRAANGSRVGTVDGVEGGRIKLTRKGSLDGEPHYVDLGPVERVDEPVHLADVSSVA